MNQSEQNQFKSALLRLAAVFERELSEVTIDAYWEALERFSLAQIESASKYCEQHCRFFPKPVEIIEALAKFPPAPIVAPPRRLEARTPTPEETAATRAEFAEAARDLKRILAERKQGMSRAFSKPMHSLETEAERELRMRELRKQAKDMENSDGEI